MSEEEIPIELYLKANGDTVKYVRYEDYEKLHSIIKEVREYIEDTDFDSDDNIIVKKVGDSFIGGFELENKIPIELLKILDKEKE